MTPEEFDQLARENYHAVYLVAYARLKDSEAAQDAAQETFLRAYLSIEQLQDKARFAAWVCRIARNLAIDWVRASAREKLLMPAIESERISEHNNPGLKNSRQSASAAEEKRRAEQALDQLEPELREVLLLHYVEELSFVQISDRLAIHPTTVRYRLGKAAAKCRRLLASRVSMSAVLPGAAGTGQLSNALLALSAVSAEARHSLASKAIASTQRVTASLPNVAATPPLLFKPLAAMAYAGGIIMASKQVVLAATAVVLLAGSGGYYFSQHRGVMYGRPVVEGPVTIQRTRPGTMKSTGISRNNSTVFTSCTVSRMLAWINHSGENETIEKPNLPQEAYDITVKVEPFVEKQATEILCRRFGLRVRHETIERDVLVLTAPSGIPPALHKPTSSQSTTAFVSDSSGKATGFKTTNMHIRQFYGIVEEMLHKPIINETGIPLTQYFDYQFSWQGLEGNEPGLIKAVNDQLGFVLTPARRPVDMLIIEKKS